MARPLKYDTQFNETISSQLYSYFLFFIKFKVPGTAFCTKLNLQTSIRLISSIDIFFSIFYILFANKNYTPIIFERLVLYFTLLFGYIGFTAAINLTKTYSNVFYFWHLILFFSIPICESLNFFHHDNICYLFFGVCGGVHFSIMTGLYVIISGYFLKITWAFSSHISKGNVILVIHGRYLENMLEKENDKINSWNYYTPPAYTNYISNTNNSNNNRSISGSLNKQGSEGSNFMLEIKEEKKERSMFRKAYEMERYKETKY